MGKKEFQYPSEAEKKSMGFDAYFKIYHKNEIKQYKGLPYIIEAIRDNAKKVYQQFYGVLA